MSEKKKIPIIRYLSYLLVVSLLFTGVTFSRYSMTTSGDSSAPLSRFHCSYEVDEISATSIPNVNYWLNNKSAASTARTLRYSISNFKGDVTSDVAVKAHLRVYLPAEMARHLALQIGTMNIAEGTVTSYTPEIVLDELITAREADRANAQTVINTSSFKNYYDSGVHNAADEELTVSGSLAESASPRTISAVNQGGSGLSFTVTASTKEAQYSLGFQRGKNENDYAPQLFLDLVRKTEFYTIDLYLPSMEFPAGQPLTKMYIVYLTLTKRLEGSDFDAHWSGADAVRATTDADGKVPVENNSVLINSPPAAAGEAYYYNGAKVLGYHFDQTTQFAAQATAEGDTPKSTTVRIQCLYDAKEGGYDIKLFHVAPITEDSTENYVHPIEPDGQSSIKFENGTFSGNFSKGTCDQNQKIDLTNIVAHPFTEGLNAYQVLSKSYEVNFKALFVQASESEV